MEPTIWTTLADLVRNLWTLFTLVAALAFQWIFLVMWVAWWLWGVNWAKLWPQLAKGAWAPLVLLLLLVALVWSRFSMAPLDVYGFFYLPNFWWQLGAVGGLVGLALFCGWLQGVAHWAPAEISVEPPPAHHGHGHDTHH